MPAIISYPEKLQSGESRNAMATACDWLPTLLDLCEIKFQADQFTGKSLKKVLLENSLTPHKALKWTYNGQRAVRKGDWKLVNDVKDTTKGVTHKMKAIKGYFLYNLKNDRAEARDVSADNPKIVEELKALLPIKAAR